jgi:hypothetical protein
MPSDISIMLAKFVDWYRREPFALEVALDGASGIDTEDIPIHQQLENLSESDSKVRQLLLRKTLITAAKNIDNRHADLQEQLGDSRESASLGSRMEVGHLHDVIDRAKKNAREAGFSIEEYRVEQAKLHQSSSDIRAEVLRIFASCIDDFAEAIRGLSEARLDEDVPDHQQELFRQCHINFALGHKATACILCGAILERCLKDCLKSSDNFGKLLEQAKKGKLLVRKEDIEAATEIYKARTDAIHGNPGFSLMKPKKVILVIETTRHLVAGLYRTSKTHSKE